MKRGLVGLTISLVLHSSVLALLSAPLVRGPRAALATSGEFIWSTAPLRPAFEAPSYRVVRKQRLRSAPPAPLKERLPTSESDIPRNVSLLPRGLLSPTDSPVASEQAQVAYVVGAWARSATAEARVRSGLVNPTYDQLGAAMRAAALNAPREVDTNSPSAVAEALFLSWAAGSETYGATGLAHAASGLDERIERPSALADAVARGHPNALALAQLLSAGARLQEFADGNCGLKLTALVELQQRSSGAFESTLKNSSGLVQFDTWVLERASQVARTLEAAPGTAPRSLWRFDATIRYRRKLDASVFDGGLARTAVGLLTTAALSTLSSTNHEAKDEARPLGPRMPGLLGRFDEFSGILDVVDLSNPSYECTVRLVEAE